MRLIRFMGTIEFDKIIAGMTLLNVTNWQAHGADSDSMGFCFFSADDDTKERQLRYVNGVEDIYTYALIMEPVGPIRIKSGWGRYRDIDKLPNASWTDSLQIPTKMIREYSTISYNREMLKILEAYAIELDIDRQEWQFRSVPF